MRELNVGIRNYTKIFSNDEIGKGNSYNNYVIAKIDGVNQKPIETVAKIGFQNGPVKEVGINGCHNEDLLAIVVDRLQGFQTGEFACRENEMAILKLEESLMWLMKRTQDRRNKGIDGTNKI